MTENPLRPPEEIIAELLSKPFHEISQGFPIRKASELAIVYFKLLMDGVSRLPIIAMKDGKVFMLASVEKNQHSTLLDNLSVLGYSKDNIAFTTSLETFTNDPPKKPYLQLNVSTEKTFYIKIGEESDKFPMFPLGKTDLSGIFASPDIIVVQ